MDVQKFRLMYGDFDKKSKEIANLRLQHAGLTPDQGKLFMYIMIHPNVNQKEICEYYHITKGTLSIQLKKLEQLNYIKKEIDEKDKRNYKLSITDKGKEANNHIYETLKQLDQETFSSVTNEEIEKAIKLFEKLNIKLNEMIKQEKGAF